MTDDDDSPGETVYVTSQVDDENRYHVHLELGDDEIVPLTDEFAKSWAAHVLKAVSVAEYEAAIYLSMTSFGVEPEAVAQVIGRMRHQRPTPDPVMENLDVRGALNAQTKEACLFVFRHGSIAGTWTLSDARTHALHILESQTVADLDTQYLAELCVAGISPQQARAAVFSLRHEATP